ncbi:MAG: hypothetical protein STSR0008_24210 [Ignavibacterium sp.]
MIRKTSIIILLFSFSLVCVACDKNESNTKEQNTNLGLVEQSGNTTISEKNASKAPDFSLVDINGKTVKLSDHKNKVVMLDFWATWCPPCRKGIPDLVKLQKKYKDQLVIIGISLDTDTKKDVVPFAKNYGINYPVVYGNQEVVNNYGGIEAIPTSFIIDKKGNIVQSFVGLMSISTYEEIIQNLLNS